MAAPTVAWAALASRESTDFAADKPLVAVQAIVSPAGVRWNDEGTVAGADHTLSTAPCRRGYDGLLFPTSPDATDDNEWYYVIQGPAAGMTFDCAFILGHNFGTLGLTTVTLEVADSADFATNPRELCDFGNPANDDRLAAYDLHHTGAVPLRYSDVVYARLKLARGANFTPSFREIIHGRRYQLDRKPDRPWDELAYANSDDVEESESGIDYLETDWRNRLLLDAEWPVEDSSYISDWRAFWTGCRGTFVWCQAPTSAPNSWNLMVRRQTEIDYPLQDGGGRMTKLQAREQGPEQYYLANE